MQLLFTASVTPVIHNWWDIKDQNAQLVELIMFFKVRCTTPASPCLTQQHLTITHSERVIKDWQQSLGGITQQVQRISTSKGVHRHVKPLSRNRMYQAERLWILLSQDTKAKEAQLGD